MVLPALVGCRMLLRVLLVWTSSAASHADGGDSHVSCSCHPEPLACACNAAQAFKQVTLIMAWTTGPYERFARSAAAVNSDFARHVGFGFRCRNLPAGSPLKARRTKPQILKEELSKAPASSWLLWMDVDAVVTNFSWPLQQILLRAQAQKPSLDLVGSKDPTSSARHGGKALMNTGVLLLRNTPWARKLVDHWIEVPTQNEQDDQYALNYLIVNHAAWKRKSAILDTTVLNSQMPMYVNTPVPPVAHLMVELNEVRTAVLEDIRSLRCRGASPTQDSILSATEGALLKFVKDAGRRPNQAPAQEGRADASRSSWDSDGVSARVLHLFMVKRQLCLRRRSAGTCAGEADALRQAIREAEAQPPRSAKLWLTIGNAMNALEHPSVASVGAYRAAIALERNFKSGSGVTAEERLIKVLRDLGRQEEAAETCALFEQSDSRVLRKLCSKQLDGEL